MVMKCLLFILVLSQFETVHADLVAPASASMEFREAPPASPAKIKPATTTPVNQTAPAAGEPQPAAQSTFPSPGNVAMQQPLPSQQAAGQPVMIPTVPAPNISANDNPQQAQTMIQQFLQLLTGQDGAPSKTLPNGQPNPAYSSALGGSSTYRGEYGAPVNNGNYPGLASAPDLNATDAAKRLKGHTCSGNDKDRLACMVCNLMYEAGNEPEAGKMAVVQSVMTRAFSGAYPDTVCKVVYQNNGRVAQYSWTFEKKNHTLPNSSKVDELVKIALDGMKKGPNGLTNYYAWNLVNPSWGRTGECARTSTRVGNHQFCRINGVSTRSVSQYLAAERLPASLAPENAPGAVR